MYLIINNHKFLYNVQSVAQIFFQNETFVNVTEVTKDGYVLKSELINDELYTTLYLDGVEQKSSITVKNTDISHSVKVSVFLILREYFNYYPAYGLMTGIRPTKLVQKLIEKKHSDKEIEEVLKNKYFVSSDKIDFLLKVSKNELDVLTKINVKNNAIYIGIPFCPSICAYCSFTSFNMKKYKDNGMMTVYVDYLIKEIEYVVSNTDNEIENIYIGGGTPTSLDDKNLERLLSTVYNIFDLQKIKEFTVEAGRVDTIRKSNLLLMKKYGVNRISINAQTMHNDTLKLNGRTHTKEQFIETFNLARDIGFDFINVDLIVGLLGDNEEKIVSSLEQIIYLKPENITIHTLAIKKGSIYKQNLENYSFLSNEKLGEVLSKLYWVLYKVDYLPYYMYRQKNILGNFENAGFSLKGRESLYNVSMILEVQSIIGLGAGSASKFVKNENITRVYNLKGVEEYIHNFDTILERKNIFID